MSAVVGASRVPLSAMAARFAKREAIGSFHPWLTSAHEVGCCKFATLRGLDPHARFRDGGRAWAAHRSRIRVGGRFAPGPPRL